MTQATVSRDIAELGLRQGARASTVHVYVVARGRRCAPASRRHVATTAFGGSCADIPVTVGRSGLILVLDGTPGTASVIAQAIDESTLHEQEGTLAGRQHAPRPLRRRSRLERWRDRFAGSSSARSGGSTHTA